MNGADAHAPEPQAPAAAAPAGQVAEQTAGQAEGQREGQPAGQAAGQAAEQAPDQVAGHAAEQTAAQPAAYGMPAVADELEAYALDPQAGTPLTAAITAVPAEATARYALELGDDALIMAQRLGELVAKGPELEEDIALTNIGLDQLGAARLLLQYAGRGLGRSEDELAYFRDESEFRCCALVEQPNGDFAQTIAKVFLVAHFQQLLYGALLGSADEFLAAVAAKSLKEVDYHVEHADLWVLRLGDGTAESHRRMQQGLAEVWPAVAELFDDTGNAELITAGIAPERAGLREAFEARVAEVIEQATLSVPTAAPLMVGARQGRHTPHLGFLLAEMQVLARQHPGATW